MSDAAELRERMAGIIALNPSTYEQLQSYRNARKKLTELQPGTQRWQRGRCEFTTSIYRAACGRPGKWLVDGQVRCSEHGLKPEVRA